MITKEYTINFALTEETTSGGLSRWPVTWTVSKSSTCIQIDDQFSTGTLTADGSFKIVVQTDDETCIENENITIQYVDAIGCAYNQTVTLVNPCSLALGDINNPSDLTFSISASGGTPGYQYSWDFDQNIFQAVNSTTSNILSLTLRAGQVADSVQVTVTVTDQAGCVASKTLNKEICSISTTGQLVQTFCTTSTTQTCVSNLKASNQRVNLNVTTSGCSIDWSTFEYSGANGICIYRRNPVTFPEDFTIEVDDSVGSGTSVVTYSVKNEYGLVSNTGALIIDIPSCSLVESGGNIIDGETSEQQLTADKIVSDTIDFDLENKIYSTSPLDWSTFSIDVNPDYGTASLTADRKLRYTISSLVGSDPDRITWSISNVAGQTLSKTYYLNRDVAAAPVAVNDTICVSCFEPSAPTDITANDTGDIDKSTIVITQNDPDVTIARDKNNDFIFTTNNNAAFVNIVKYKVANSQGLLSNEGSIIINSTCAGIPTPSNLDITCFSNKAFNLQDYVVNGNAFSKTWTETTGTAPTYTTQGGTITGSQGAVDFSAIATGRTYTFEVEATGDGTCPAQTHTETINIILNAPPAVTISSATNLGSNVGKIEFTVEGVTSLGSLTITNNGDRPTYISSPTLISGSGEFTFQMVAGNNVVLITAITTCGTTVSDTDTIVN